MKVWLSPTGKAISGHVLDCAKAPLEKKIKELFDDYLYLKWNPKKLNGWGCWELRRRPEKKKVLETLAFKGNTYTILGYKENNFENHILDVPFLNYSIINKLKSMDTWEQYGERGKHFGKELEYHEEKSKQLLEEKTRKEREYNAKQLKHELKDFREYVLSGHNPYLIADHWK